MCIRKVNACTCSYVDYMIYIFFFRDDMDLYTCVRETTVLFFGTLFSYLKSDIGVLGDSVVKCLTRNQGLETPFNHSINQYKVFFEGKLSLSICESSTVNFQGTCLHKLESKSFSSFSILTVTAFNLFQNKPWFLPVCSTSILKTLWEKDKLLVMSNLSFSHRVFDPLGELSAIFTKLSIVVCRIIEFGSV